MVDATHNPAADDNAKRIERLRAIGEAAIINPNDTAALDAAILELGGEANDTGVSMIRGLVEQVKSGALSQKQAQETLAAQLPAQQTAQAPATETPTEPVIAAAGAAPGQAAAVSATQSGGNVNVVGAAAQDGAAAAVSATVPTAERDALLEKFKVGTQPAGKSVA